MSSKENKSSIKDDSISRRTFFFKLSKSLIEISGGTLAIYGAVDLINKSLEAMTKPSDIEKSKSFLDEFFEDIGRFQINCGKSHILFPQGVIHPDIRDAAISWRNLFPSDKIKNISLPDSPNINLDGDILALGSPGSNLFNKIIFNFEGPMDDLSPIKNSKRPKLDYIHAKSNVENRFGLINRYADNIKLTTPNWIIIDTETGEEFIPRKDDQGFITSDYLLISKFPNTLSSKARERGSDIILLGGAHGSSLKGLGSIIFDYKIIENLMLDLKGCRYFQILFQMYGITHNHTNSITNVGKFKLLKFIGYSNNQLIE